MEMERDVVVFTDDEGNEIELDVIDYFEHDGQDYAVLVDLAEDIEDADDEDEVAQEVYIMKIVVKDDIEEFLPPDEALYEVLIGIVEERLSGECDCDGEHDHDCDCGHHHHE